MNPPESTWPSRHFSEMTYTTHIQARVSKFPASPKNAFRAKNGLATGGDIILLKVYI